MESRCGFSFRTCRLRWQDQKTGSTRNDRRKALVELLMKAKAHRSIARAAVRLVSY
jgi:hypothetical protein